MENPLLDHERLDVYRLAVAFDGCVIPNVPLRGHRVLRDQLERSSTGIALCIAEGAGRRSAGDKRRFYEMARGSATESAAALDLLRARRAITEATHAAGRSYIVASSRC